jgi:hypothetical protein
MIITDIVIHLTGETLVSSSEIDLTPAQNQTNAGNNDFCPGKILLFSN